MIKLIANGIQLDVYEDTELNITFTIEDILDLNTRRSSWSKDFNLPGTSKNREFFQNIQETNIDIRKSFLIAIPVQLFKDDKTIIVGSLRLLRSIQNGGDLIFQVQITGRVRDLMNELERMEVRSLEFTGLNHTRNTGTVLNSWNNNSGYVYPYIVNGQSNDIFKEVYLWDLFPAMFVKDIVDEAFNKTGFTYESKFLNSDYFKTLVIPWTRDVIQDVDINKRICDVGLTPLSTVRRINYVDQTNPGTLQTNTTDFAPMTPYRERATSWWNSSSLANRIRLNDTTTIDFRDDLNSWEEIQVGFIPPPVGSFSAGQWVSKVNGIYNIRFKAFVFPQYRNVAGGPVIYNDSKLGFEYNYRLVHIKNNGTQIVLDQTDGTQFFNQGSNILGDEEIDLNSDIPNMQPWVLSAEDIFLEEGDKIQVRWGFRFPSLNFTGNNSNIRARLVMKRDFGGEFSRLTITPAENKTFGNELVDMNTFLPEDLNLKDFFLDLIKMFNLIVAPDKFNTNKVIIEPREDFWLSRQRVKYWQFDKLSPHTFTPMSEVNFNRYKFSYQADQDYLNDRYTRETSKEWGQRVLKIDNDFSDIESTTTLNVFASTPVTDIWTDGRVAPMFVEKNENELRSRNVKMRILFYTGLKSSNNWSLKSNITGAGTALTQYPYVGHFDDPVDASYDLNFGPTEKIYHNQIKTTTNDLFNKFWRSTFTQLIDKNNKLLEAYFYLTSEDISDLDYRDIILVDGGFWRINEISDWSPNTLTKVQLYKINLTNTYDTQSISIPVSNRSCPRDITIATDKDNKRFYTSEFGNINADCCSTLGGLFQNGTCFLFQDTGVIIDNPPSPVKGRPISDFKDLNSVNKVGTIVNGKFNYVSKDSGVVSVSGNDTSSVRGSKDSYAFGDGITVDRPNNFYINDVAVDRDGDIVNIKPYIINGGFNTTLPASRSNVIEIVHGGVNSSRNSGGDQKKRVLISDNIPSIEFGPDQTRIPTNVSGTVEYFTTQRNTTILDRPTVIETSVATATFDIDSLYRWDFQVPLLTRQVLPIGNYYVLGNNTTTWAVLNSADVIVATFESTSSTCGRGDLVYTEFVSPYEYITTISFYLCGQSGPLGPDASF